MTTEKLHHTTLNNMIYWKQITHRCALQNKYIYTIYTCKKKLWLKFVYENIAAGYKKRDV